MNIIMQNKNGKIFKAVILIFLCLIFVSGCGQTRGSFGGDAEEEIPAAYYPDTASAPLLQFAWNESGPYGVLNLTSEASGHIYSCAPFGIIEGINEATGEIYRNQEMYIGFANRQREPIYAPCDGIITCWNSWVTFETAAGAGNGADVWIRYGKNYAVGFRHTVTQSLTWEQGDLVHKGDIIAYAADGLSGNGMFFEFVVAQKDGDKYYFRRGYDFFVAASQQKLLDIWNAVQVQSMGYNTVSNPWGDLLQYESPGGNSEIPHKAGFNLLTY